MEIINEKKYWGPGEWQQEPDMEEFEYKGLLCIIKRHPVYGSFLAYVTIPESHKFYNKDYDDIPVEVHGGLTFSGTITKKSDNTSLFCIGFDCNHYHDFAPGINDEGMPKYLDYIDDMELPDETELAVEEFYECIKNINKQFESRYTKHSKTYKNIEFARNECRKIVDQLLEQS